MAESPDDPYEKCWVEVSEKCRLAGVPICSEHRLLVVAVCDAVMKAFMRAMFPPKVLRRMVKRIERNERRRRAAWRRRKAE